MPFNKIKFFSELHEEEKIFLVIRRHWIVPAMKVVLWVFILILLGILEVLVKINFPQATEGIAEKLFGIFRTVWLMTATLGLFVIWTLYYLNVQVITNERIVDINQVGLLFHKTSELNLDRFQDVKTEIKGPLANIFNYGDVHVQTAGEEQNFIFEQIANPHQVARLILELYEELRKKQSAPNQAD